MSFKYQEASDVERMAGSLQLVTEIIELGEVSNTHQTAKNDLRGAHGNLPATSRKQKKANGNPWAADR